MVSAPAWDGTGCEFDSWQFRIYIPCSLSLRLLGSLRGSLRTYGLTQKLCWKKSNHLYSSLPSSRSRIYDHRNKLHIGTSANAVLFTYLLIICLMVDDIVFNFCSSYGTTQWHLLMLCSPELLFKKIIYLKILKFSKLEIHRRRCENWLSREEKSWRRQATRGSGHRRSSQREEAGEYILG